MDAKVGNKDRLSKDADNESLAVYTKRVRGGGAESADRCGGRGDDICVVVCATFVVDRDAMSAQRGGVGGGV